ncbi:flavodoxin [Pelosinus sp. UFO1]|uniref:flavodoxin n=1 Tax=Pelosinus sp. UFO1 TaxID=484770 RepID=UPI0006911C7D|nr:flavodoxin [Pelosinus sp. UFO1]
MILNKKSVGIILAVVVGLLFTGIQFQHFGESPSPSMSAEKKASDAKNALSKEERAQPPLAPKGKKVLIAYYTRSGNARDVAQEIKQQFGGDLFEIQTRNAYPEAYPDVVLQAKNEIQQGIKPELKNKVQDIRSYDVIFIGTPVWWGTLAPPVSSFLSAYDFSGKTVIPFCTYKTTGLGGIVGDVKTILPNANVLNGIAVKDGEVSQSKDAITVWLEGLKL